MFRVQGSEFGVTCCKSPFICVYLRLIRRVTRGRFTIHHPRFAAFEHLSAADNNNWGAVESFRDQVLTRDENLTQAPFIFPLTIHKAMQRRIVLLIVCALVWYGYTKYEARRVARSAAEAERQSVTRQPLPAADTGPSQTDFKCDGRTHCSQMTSCEEATFFLRNCPGVKMDGDYDGIPCERQWCTR